MTLAAPKAEEADHQGQGTPVWANPILAEKWDSSSFFLVVLAKHKFLEALAIIVLGDAWQ